MDADPEFSSGAKPPETVHEYFVAQLRRLRDAHDLSQSQLARLINYVPSQVSMVETMQRPPTPDFAAACDRALNTGGSLLPLLRFIARETYPAWFRSYVALEAEAISINEFEVQVVPGIFQTADYARAVLAAAWPPPETEEEAERRLEARLARQHVLDRENPPLLSVILDESVLRRPVGGNEVMAAQLRHLEAMAARPYIRLHVLTFSQSAHAPLDGSFTVLETPQRERIAYLESTGGGSVVPDPNAVEVLARTFEAARGEALSTAESVAYIRDLRGQLYE